MDLAADTTTPTSSRRLLAFLALLFIGLLVAHALDVVVYRQFHDSELADKELLLMFRWAGYLPVWIVVASALIFLDTAKWKAQGLRGVLERGLLIFMAVLWAGLLSEGAKCLIHRGRPPIAGWDGHYLFRPFNLLNTEGLGMPSSHAGVAFGAAWMLVRLYPRATLVWLLVAVGCSCQRILGRSHFFSDVIGALIISYAAAWMVWHGWRRIEDRDKTRPALKLAAR